MAVATGQDRIPLTLAAIGVTSGLVAKARRLVDQRLHRHGIGQHILRLAIGGKE
jgi:hypothetical protein